MDTNKHSVSNFVSFVRKEGMMKKLAPYLIPNLGTLIILGLFFAASATGAMPLRAPVAAPSTTMISYQGQLTDPDGTPLTGTYDMHFALYDVPTGGTACWTEPRTGSNAVPVSDGLFNVLLGSVSVEAIAPCLTGDVYLGITVGSDSEMTPRELLGSVPHALQASTVPDGSITTAKIADDAVTGTKIANGAVTEAKLANGAVTASKIADGEVTNTEIANGAVTEAKISNGAVTASKIADGEVTNSKIANDAVTEAKLSNGAVTAPKIVDGEVTGGKIANDAITASKIADGEVTSAKIANGAITEAKISNGAVTTSKISDGAITPSKLSERYVLLSESAGGRQRLDRGTVSISSFPTYVSFATAFSQSPTVVAVHKGDGSYIANVSNVSSNGFEIRVRDHLGNAITTGQVDWIAVGVNF